MSIYRQSSPKLKTYKITLRPNNYMMFLTLLNTPDSLTTSTRLHNLAKHKIFNETMKDGF